MSLEIRSAYSSHNSDDGRSNMARAAGPPPRLPLQARHVNKMLATGSSSSSSEECPSKESNRASTLESSNNENNKRISSFNGSGYRIGSGSSLVGSEPDSSLTTHTGAGARAPVKGIASVPILNRASSAPEANTRVSITQTSSTADMSQAGSSDDSVMIEEKRRKVNGDGYSYHRYLRGKLLGKGGFAKVYMCTALDTNKHYAVKVVPKANLVKTRARQKLQAEIKIHRTLKHKHICEYKHFFEDKTNCYILLELCHNQSMNEMIKRRKRLTEPEAAYFMNQLIKAVEYMHENLVIHRDLKLGNLFLDRNMHIKVGDLGLATRLDSADEKRKTICGTPNYIAPEVIQGNKETRGHSFEVDIWSMGVILFTTLVGKPPYEAKDVKSTYQRIVANQYSFPSHVTISEHARSLIVAMLQSKPEERPLLDEIRCHPFFTASNVKIPKSLPSNATHVAPEWRVDDRGDLVAYRPEDENQRRITNSKLLQQSDTRSASQRQPFATVDPNVDQKNDQLNKNPTGKGVLDIYGLVRSAIVASGSSLASSSPFAIYDETGPAASKELKPSNHSKPPQVRPTTSVEEITSRAAALGLEPPTKKNGPNSDGMEPLPAPVDKESEVMLQMLERLCAVVEVSESRKYAYYGSQASRPVSRGGPTRWVTRYVDYTSKYGLGFLLNDGSSGVYFNDSTKAVLEANGDNFQYIERRKGSSDTNDASSKKLEPSCEMHSLAIHPESLQKKVTLLKHFRNYLIEQQKKADEDDSGSEDYVADHDKLSLVYLKKWVRTKHAILFRLSDQTVQIVFYDQTEVLMTPDERFVTYVDKRGDRFTYYLNDELVGANAELAKRLKYSKEILHQLIVGQKR